MSFFDDDDQTQISPPPRQPARPRRPAAESTASGGAPVDRTQARTRQLIAAAIGIVVLLVLIFGVRGCLSSRADGALKDYNRNASAIINNSDSQVAKPFFDLLETGGGTDAAGGGNDLQVQINQIRLAAEEDSKRSAELSVPGDMRPAQQNLELTLHLREEAVTRVAELLPKAQGTGQGAETAINEIAGEMQAFLASDVIYSQRTAPLIKQALDNAGITGQAIATSQSLPSYSWLAPKTIAAALGGNGVPAGQPAPGLHGHELVSTSIGDTTLEPSPAANKVSAKPPVAVVVKFTNGGENNERNVNVTITITAPGSKEITAKKVVNQTNAGEDTTVSIALPSVPTGGAATMKVRVAPVPGEQTTDNNEQTYTVLFGG
ncbi:MAG: hypothetical protein ACKOB9_08275 [Solirubrobacterales bacterium]